VIAPALIGYGVWKRIAAHREQATDPDHKPVEVRDIRP
jgi:hypothetical protein